MSDPADPKLHPTASTPAVPLAAAPAAPAVGTDGSHAGDPPTTHAATAAVGGENKPPQKSLLKRSPEPEKESEIDLRDPTAPLAERSRDHDQYHSIRQEAAQYAHRLRNHGYLVIGCHHEGCAEAASFEILGNPELGEVDQRYVESSLTLDEVLDRKLRPYIGATRGRNVALLVHRSEQDGLAEIKRGLQSRGRVGLSTDDHFYVVIQLTGTAWQQYDGSTVFGTTPVWPVDARRHLLARFGVLAESLAAKLAAIEQARVRGVLPNGEDKLLARLQQVLESGSLDAFLETQGKAPDLPPSVETLAADLLGKANNVEKLVLFLTANLPELRIGEFETLMQVLLAGLPSPRSRPRGEDPPHGGRLLARRAGRNFPPALARTRPVPRPARPWRVSTSPAWTTRCSRRFFRPTNSRSWSASTPPGCC